MSTKTLIALAVGLAASAADAQQFWNLGASRLSTSISNDGTVVGDNTATLEYFMWTAGGGQVSIGGRVAGDGVGGQATISHDGLFVGGTVFNANSGTHEMGRYSVGTGTWTPLGGIGAVSDAETSSGWGISGDGSSIVGLGWVTPGSAHGVQWRQGTGMVDLGTTTPGNSSRANNTNFDGSVVVGWQDNDNGRQGAVWVNGAQELIFNNDGFAASEALSVSNNGTYVSGIQFGGFFEPSELWRYNTQTDTYEGLGNLTDGGRRGDHGRQRHERRRHPDRGRHLGLRPGLLRHGDHLGRGRRRAAILRVPRQPGDRLRGRVQLRVCDRHVLGRHLVHRLGPDGELRGDQLRGQCAHARLGRSARPCGSGRDASSSLSLVGLAGNFGSVCGPS
jgi:hypothetical protein